MCFFVQYFHSKFLNNIAHTKKNMIQYIPYRWVRIVQIYSNQHPVPAKLNNTWKQVKERKGEKK